VNDDTEIRFDRTAGHETIYYPRLFPMLHRNDYVEFEDGGYYVRSCALLVHQDSTLTMHITLASHPLDR